MVSRVSGADKVSLTPPPNKRRWQPFHFLKVRPRMLISLSIFIVVSVLLVVAGLKPTIAVLLGFDLGAVVF